MADNVTITQGTGTDIGADEISSVKYQRIKLIHGADGTNDGDVASGNPLPVTDSANEALLTTIDADTGSIATDASTIAGDTTSIDGKITACNTGAVVLAAGAAAIGKLAANSGVDIGDVDVTSCALPTGASTAAKQGIAGTDLVGGAGAVAAGVQRVTLASDDPAVTDLAALEVLATSIDGDTGAIKTAVETIDNAISGSEMQVDIVAALPAGTNNIGDVDVLSMLSGKTIKRAVISGATSGNNTIVAAVADKKIKVLSVCLVAVTAVTVRFESGADGTALTGVMSIGATGGFVLPAPPDPTCHWFETGVNTLLNMELGDAVQVSGCITYYEEA